MSRTLKRLTVAPRHENPYATHLPILIGLAKVMKVTQVIEFGSGTYSTLTFLNRNYFPDLASMSSYENDPIWADEVNKGIGADPRCTLHTIEGPMYVAAAKVNLDAADLIFIDDSTSADERAQTIKHAVSTYKGNGIIVIHDFEVPPYQDAAASAPYAFRFAIYTPNTGVVWHSSNAQRQKALQALSKVIKKYSKSISPDDRDGWKCVLDQNFRP
jgi:predicted O-methyltransferase YrrM